MAYVIGIDSGGTKTEGVAYDLNGQAIKTVIKGFGNLLVDYETGLRNIQTTISELLSSCGDGCELIVLGLAGVDSGDFKKDLEEQLKEAFNLPTVIVNDAQLAHLALLQGQEGILLISGTGSVAIGCKENDWQRVGGWGHLLGDDGSAYDIALQGIKLGLYEYDHNLSYSDLTKKLLAHFKSNDIFKIVKLFYQLNKGQVAELAMVVTESAESCTEAQDILKEAGRSLAKQVILLNRKLAFNQPVLKIGLNGSVIKNNQLVKEAFLEELTANDIQVEVVEATESNAKGAYYLYKKGWMNT